MFFPTCLEWILSKAHEALSTNEENLDNNSSVADPSSRVSFTEFIPREDRRAGHGATQPEWRAIWGLSAFPCFSSNCSVLQYTQGTGAQHPSSQYCFHLDGRRHLNAHSKPCLKLKACWAAVFPPTVLAVPVSRGASADGMAGQQTHDPFTRTPPSGNSKAKMICLSVELKNRVWSLWPTPTS